MSRGPVPQSEPVERSPAGAAGSAAGILGRVDPTVLQAPARVSRQAGILGQEAEMANQEIEDQNSPYQQYIQSLR